MPVLSAVRTLKQEDPKFEVMRGYGAEMLSQENEGKPYWAVSTLG